MENIKALFQQNLLVELVAGIVVGILAVPQGKTYRICRF
jgi:MFS superfamily sulfate permease-like transporter